MNEMQTKRNYIGVTGFRDRQEIEEISKFADQLESKCRVHYGVMTGRKKLSDIPSKYSHSFLSYEALDNIFPAATESTMNCVHYADYGEDVDPLITMGILAKICFYCNNMQALQLDMVLPSEKAINPIVTMFPHIEVILQINPETLAQKTTEQLKEYLNGFIRVDWLLFDQSKGTGKKGDPAQMEKFINDFPEYRVALAGGLGPETLTVLGPLQGKTSIDAQGRLTRAGEDQFNPYLDLAKVKAYLQTSTQAYG